MGRETNASVRRTLIYKFKKVLHEGAVYSFQYFGVAANRGSYRTCSHSYKLNFQFSTKVVYEDVCLNRVESAMVAKLFQASNLLMSLITRGSYTKRRSVLIQSNVESLNSLRSVLGLGIVGLYVKISVKTAAEKLYNF